MSASEQGLSPLVIDAGDPWGEIELFDGNLKPVPLQHNLGRVEVPLPPGVYVVRFRAGTAISQDHPVLHEPKAPTRPDPVVRPKKRLAFSSAAPLPGTSPSTYSEAHQESATRLAGQAPARPPSGRGGGRLLVFARDHEPESLRTSHPLRGLSLHNLRGERLIDLEESSGSPAGLHCAGHQIELTPGAYLLRLTTGEADTCFERLVHVNEGWLTQVFLLTVAWSQDEANRFADFSRFSVFQTPVGDRIDFADARFREAEMGLRPLERSAAVPGPAQGNSLRSLADHNPLLALYALHLHLRRAAQDPTVLSEVAARLWQTLPGPDVVTLDWALALQRGQENLAAVLPKPRQRALVLPPMLSASWNLALAFEASKGTPSLVPAGSLADAIAGEARPAGPWLVWRDEHPGKRPDPSTYTGETVNLTDRPPLKRLSRDFTRLAVSFQDDRGLAERVTGEEFTNLERRVAQAAAPVANPALRALFEVSPALAELMAKGPAAPPETGEGVIERLMLPTCTALRGLQEVLEKLKLNEFSKLFLGVVLGKDLEPALRACHRPCQRLVVFEDFYQDVLKRALEYQKTFRGKSDLEMLGWLKAIGRQRMVDQLRGSQKERPETLPREVTDPRAAPAPDQLGTREEWEEQSGRLNKVLADLSEDDRELLVRVHQGGEKLRDIAEELGIPANTLVQRHVRLLKRLRQEGQAE